MNLLLMTGLITALPGCAALYLASPNQRWLATAWPRLPARAAGFILLLVGYVALLQTLQAAAATFVFVHWVMLLFVLFPYLGALHAVTTKARP